MLAYHRLVSLLRQRKDSIEKRQLLLTVKKVSNLSSTRRESSSSQNSIPDISHIHTHSYTGQLPYPQLLQMLMCGEGVKALTMHAAIY